MKVIVTGSESEVSAAVREYAHVLACEALGPHRKSLLGVEVRLSVDASEHERSARCEVRIAMQPRGAFALSVREGRIERAIARALSDVESVLRTERNRTRARSVVAANNTQMLSAEESASAA